HHRCGQGLRHHLRDQPGRARHGVGDPQYLPLSAGLRLLQHRLRLGRGGGVLRAHHRALARPPLRSAEEQMVALAATPPSRRPRRHLKRLAHRVAFALAVFVIVSPAILVFLWMLSLSVKPEIENIAYPPVFIPEHPTLANFARVFEASPFGHYLVNSLIVTGSATLLAIAVGVPAGYGIAKAKAYRLAVLVLIARITPNLSYLIPLFIVFQMLGLTGTLWPMVITHLVITVPIVVWVMIGFFETLHPDLEEAALIDGATLWQAFRFIALPLSRPGVVVAAILAFIFSWNNFIFGVVL